jgi:glyoxylase-like metal-dependent hydrolase (beta-lactamase superfamily II)
MTDMAFLTEPAPTRSALLPVLPGIHRIVAANPTRMTYHGTNTYLIEDPDGVTVVDPGPDDAVHVADILRLTPAPIRRILLTHTHRDHVGALLALKAATGAATYGWHRSADPGFVPDVPLQDGETGAGLMAVFTPGHAADHICFARPDGLLFSGDHVMSWSSSVVSPPGGDMSAYFASLERLLTRPDTIYLPGHGPKLPDPQPFVRSLLDHRIAREQAIAAAIARQPYSTIGLVDALYSKIDPVLRLAAERNVIAHLAKLEREGRARRHGDEWQGA